MERHRRTQVGTTTSKLQGTTATEAEAEGGHLARLQQCLRLRQQLRQRPQAPQQRAPQALRMTKTLLRQGRDGTFDQILEMTASMQALAHLTVQAKRLGLFHGHRLADLGAEVYKVVDEQAAGDIGAVQTEHAAFQAGLWPLLPVQVAYAGMALVLVPWAWRWCRLTLRPTAPPAASG